MALFDSSRFGNDPLALFRGLPSMRHSKLAKQVNRLRRYKEWCDNWHLWDAEERLKKSFKTKRAEHLAAISKIWTELAASAGHGWTNFAYREFHSPT